MPNLRQLEYLVALDEERHFRRAAERANTTQPTLSEQLKALEVRLGAQLVERARNKVMITPLGAQIVQIARRMLADADEIRALASSGGRELAGILRLGLPASIGPYFLPSVIPELQRKYADLKLYVREELPSDLPNALSEGRHDLLVSLLPIKQGDIDFEELFREPLYLTVAKGHPLAKKGKVTRSDLAGEDILALARGHQLHDAALALSEEFGGRLRYDYEGTSLDTLREMVAMGLGVTFLPGLYARAVALRDDNIAVLELGDRAIYRTVGIMWRRSSARHDQYRALAQLMRSLVEAEFPDCTVLGAT